MSINLTCAKCGNVFRIYVDEDMRSSMVFCPVCQSAVRNTESTDTAIQAGFPPFPHTSITAQVPEASFAEEPEIESDARPSILTRLARFALIAFVVINWFGIQGYFGVGRDAYRMTPELKWCLSAVNVLITIFLIKLGWLGGGCSALLACFIGFSVITMWCWN